MCNSCKFFFAATCCVICSLSMQPLSYVHLTELFKIISVVANAIKLTDTFLQGFYPGLWCWPFLFEVNIKSSHLFISFSGTPFLLALSFNHLTYHIAFPSISLPPSQSPSSIFQQGMLYNPAAPPSLPLSELVSVLLSLCIHVKHLPVSPASLLANYPLILISHPIHHTPDSYSGRLSSLLITIILDTLIYIFVFQLMVVVVLMLVMW